MKYFTILVFSFCCIAAQAQSSWNWGISLSAGISGEKDRVFEIYENGDFGNSHYLVEKKYQPVYSGGIWVGKSLGRHFETTLGLEYLQRGEFNRTENTYFNNLDAMASFYQTDNYLTSQSIQAPFNVNYFFRRTDKLFRPYIGLGIAASYNLKLSNFSESISANAGFEEYYSNYENSIDWSQDYFKDYRWNFPLNINIGARLGNMRISVEYSLVKTKESDYYGNDYCYTGGGIIGCCCYCDCYYPYYVSASTVATKNYKTINFQYQF